MATEWKSQQCFDEGKYYLQFETDDRDKFKFMEKMAQSAIDGHSDRIIILPCKVGDTVYVGVEGASCVLKTKVLAIGVDEDGDFVLNPYEYPDDVFCISGANIGKTVFLTREEAEARLKGEQ